MTWWDEPVITQLNIKSRDHANDNESALDAMALDVQFESSYLSAQIHPLLNPHWISPFIARSLVLAIPRPAVS